MLFYKCKNYEFKKIRQQYEVQATLKGHRRIWHYIQKSSYVCIGASLARNKEL